MKLRTISVLLVLGCLATLSPAPIFDKHAPSKISPEASQQELAHEQSIAHTQDVVGSVPSDVSVRNNAGEKSDGSAALMLRSTQQQVKDPSVAANTVAVLKTAEQNVENSKPAPMRALFWVLFAACFGYGAFYGFRRWADKNIPEPAKLDDIKW